MKNKISLKKLISKAVVLDILKVKIGEWPQKTDTKRFWN